LLVWPFATDELNSRVETPEIVSVPVPVTAMTLVPVPPVFSKRPELVM
jgi:hypothetical protein